MKVEVVAKPNDLDTLVPGDRLSYREAVDLAFQRIKQNEVVSSWKDAVTSSLERDDLNEHVEIPTFGCFIDKKRRILDQPGESVKQNIWRIGGDTGWYYGNALWRFRGFLDKLVGGVGLRRGRRSAEDLWAGDALDFWRVLIADEQRIRLLLYAEMKLPGEAWLEWKIIREGEHHVLQQTATFRPWGLLGRIYWYAVLPFHYFVFNGMIDALSTKRSTTDTNHS